MAVDWIERPPRRNISMTISAGVKPRDGWQASSSCTLEATMYPSSLDWLASQRSVGPLIKVDNRTTYSTAYLMLYLIYILIPICLEEAKLHEIRLLLRAELSPGCVADNVTYIVNLSVARPVQLIEAKRAVVLLHALAGQLRPGILEVVVLVAIPYLLVETRRACTEPLVRVELTPTQCFDGCRSGFPPRLFGVP